MPKTPKSSTVPAPTKTPKSSQERKSTAKTPARSLATVKANSQGVAATDKTASDTTVVVLPGDPTVTATKKRKLKEPKEPKDPKVPKDHPKVPKDRPQVPKAKKLKTQEVDEVGDVALPPVVVKEKKEKKEHIQTLIDGVDPKELMGQYTRARDLQKLAIASAEQMTVDGLLDTSLVPNFVRPTISEEWTQHALATAPIKKLRFAKSATHWTMKFASDLFLEKAADLQRLCALTQKQTVTLDMVWAERLYREKLNLQSAMAIQAAGPVTELSMMEDCESGYPAEGMLFSQEAWKQYQRAHNLLRGSADTPAAQALVSSVYGRWGNGIAVP